MNDDDNKSALEWAKMVESEKGRVRELDIYPRIVSWLDRGLSSAVLDIGAGQGICSEKIDLNQRAYTGVEPSAFLIERAKRLYPGKARKFIQGNAYELPCLSESFDAAFSVAVWHLLEDLPRAFVELRRVLKRTGRFLIITANPGDYSQWLALYAESTLENRKLEGKLVHPDGSATLDILYLHTWEEIVGAVHSAGLAVEETAVFRGGRFISIEGRITR